MSFPCAAANEGSRVRMQVVASSRRWASETTSFRRERGRRKFRTSSWTRQKRLADSTVLRLKAPHRPRSLFDAAMVLLQMIIQVAVGTMAHLFAQLSFDGLG